MLEENFQILTRIGQDKQVRNDSTITFLGCETVRKLHFKTKHLRVLINLDHLRGDNSGENQRSIFLGYVIRNDAKHQNK